MGGPRVSTRRRDFGWTSTTSPTRTTGWCSSRRPAPRARSSSARGVTSAAPGSVQGLYLIVFGIEEARAELVGRDVGVSEVFDDAGGLFYHGHEAGEVVHHAGGRVAGPHPDRADYGSYATFSAPDGNGWVLQEVKQRAPGR